MNCKPGDLAVIRGLVIATHCNGMLVNVLAVTNDRWWIDPDGAIWDCGSGPTACVESVGSPFPRDEFTYRESRFSVFDQRNVVPIRDPGDDARDETLEWLPVPSKELA